jgi:hypothetical protein
MVQRKRKTVLTGGFTDLSFSSFLPYIRLIDSSAETLDMRLRGREDA